MKRFLKIALWSVATIVVALGLLLWGFIYKIRHGFPVSYETEAPAINFPDGRRNVLLFSKSTGFRHGESIEAGKEVFAELAQKNNWFLYSTEEGGVFNRDQLALFDVVVFNNSTGRVLNDEQRSALEQYVQNGGWLVGIHGTGDNSHEWPWYVENFIGAEFSHHPIDPHLQQAEVVLNAVPDSTLTEGLPVSWAQTDEWYVFLENPRAKGFNILYAIDGTKIIPNGNMLWIKDKDFGMGKDHPVAWYRDTGAGRTFYTSMGHDANAWRQAPFVKMIENAVK
jgi:type 1 glutamine amidotransferase